MDQATPTTEQWRRLYAAAAQVKAMAPWEWMGEDDVFGVRDPTSGDLLFVSVMGIAGEHFAIGVYLGPRALYQFWALEDADEDLAVEKLLEIPQLQASFEDREELEKPDLDLINKLGLKFRGKNGWTMFRSMRPGFLPWFIDQAEGRFLTLALEQLLDVAPRFKADPELLNPDDEDSYLVREAQQENDTTTWADKIVAVPPPDDETLDINIDADALDQVKQLPKRKGAVEIDLFLMPTPIQEDENSRPALPYMLMTVDSQSHMVFAPEMLVVEDSLEDMWAEVPSRVLDVFAQSGFRPGEIRVTSDLLANLLPPLAEELGAKFKQVEDLPALNDARALIMEQMLSESGFSDPVG